MSGGCGDYVSDRVWADEWFPQVCKLVGPHLLEIAGLDDDTKRATDLVLIRARPHDIACRIRGDGFLEKYWDEFTVRNFRSSGARTEFEKLIDGYADWMFYGHGCDGKIVVWYLLDLAVWRAELTRDLWRKSDGKQPRLRWGCKRNSNDHGATGFAWFDIRSFPQSLVIAQGAQDGLVQARGYVSGSLQVQKACADDGRQESGGAWLDSRSVVVGSNERAGW